MSEERLLLVRRGETPFGVAARLIEGLEQQGDHVLVRMASGVLSAEEVLGLVTTPRPTPPGRVLRRFWRESCRGLTVANGLPVVVINPDRPPKTLMAEEGEERHEDDG